MSAHDSFFVRLDVGQIINLKTHSALCEFIDRLIHIIHREIKDGELGRSMVRLRINENIIAAGEMQRQQAIRFRNLEPKCAAVEFFAFSMSLAEKPLNALLSPNMSSLLVSYFVFRERLGS